VDTSDAFIFDFQPFVLGGKLRNSRSAMAKPSTASPRNSSDSLSKTPPLTSSFARDVCVSACSSNPGSRNG
jgi:hypothetical protein